MTGGQPPALMQHDLRPKLQYCIIDTSIGGFLDHEWIDIPALREFLGNSAPEAGSDASSTLSTRLSACPDLVHIKTEGADPLPLSAPPTSFKIRTSYEGGREVLEISSDSESDADEISGDLPSEFLDPQVYSGALPLLPDLADPSATPDTLMYDLNDLQLGTLFGLGSDFSANIPVATPSGFSFSTTPQYSFSENPLAALNSFLPLAASPLPLLPPPPPDSPPESAPSREELCSNSVTSKSMRAPRSKLDGLEPANILATGSARTRAPSSRKRDAEQEVSEQPSKKRKKNKV
ncbi:hypothetical protein B0H11DRAFT_2429838 [Mycena galericulata]|nr:hypothetical protein B0H11DRAFT_2429838 [Mycena galericulata]